MSNNLKVRFSRDGDQFHYLWAARRCLRLLSPPDGLTAITIEGSSPQETQTGDSIEAGEEQIDVGEYYGSEDIREATFVQYIQLKHSTQNPTEPWPPSGLEKTIRGFAQRYQELEQRFKEGGFTTPVEFCFVSNRPISTNLMEAVEDAASENTSRRPNILRRLEEFTSLSGERLSAFCKLLRLEGALDDYWLQRADLGRETNGYLPGNDVDAPVQLKELVTRKALSENKDDPSITKMDVLRVLGVTEENIFPAPSRIESAKDAVPRSQEAELVARIVNANTPVILHAEGGVGKSVLSQRIRLHLPEDSVAVVYDCFGNGEYRRRGSSRHRHKDALVQIANELAALGLCDPLIPASNADETDYLRAFAHRLQQSITAVRVRNEQALLCVIVDAADNAEIAAKEFGSERSFARDLLCEPLLDGVRLVVLCRTERQALLDPPASVRRLKLNPFSRDETAVFLRKTYADASGNDVDEFHSLTSHNPRVQATALDQDSPLPVVLLSLGPNPTTVDDTISALLQQAVDNLRETVGGDEQLQIDSICTALATLRPFVPVKVLASVSGVEIAAVRSFANDLGRPLLILEDAIQFRDEPVETWFREHFRPSDEQLSEFIERLQPLASESAYVASTLPQLMLEARQLSELVKLALSSSLLPSNPIERRDVELHRLQFALKASLRAKCFADAAKLALKAAQETAGDTRQQTLLHENTDLAAVVMEPDRIQEIVARRTFSDTSNNTQEIVIGGADGKRWTGTHHAYEAGLLSYIKDFRGDARSRLRMAYEWLMNWSRLSDEERKKERIGDNTIAEISIAQFNIDGPEACAAALRTWRPREVSYRVGRIIAQRWIDHGRYDDLNRLALAATNNFYLLLAINLKLRSVHRSPPKETVERALRLILNQCVRIKGHDFDYEETALQAITALVESVYTYQLRPNDTLATLLQRYLPETPPRSLASRHSGERSRLLRAYSLQAALKDTNLQLIDLAHPELREKLEREKTSGDSQDVREFRRQIGALLPWYKLWAENFLTPKAPPDLVAAIAEACQESTKATGDFSHERSDTSDEIADIWFDILTGSDGIDETAVEEFKTWIGGLRHPLYIPAWTRLARLAAHTPNFEHHAYEFIQRAFELTKDAKEDAESKAQTYVELARTILSTDKSEAGEYFNQAIEVASKIGDEILDRWNAILDLADRAVDPSQLRPRTAYELARCAELAHEYTYDHFNWEGTVKAIAGLCPSSCFAILSRWRDRNFGEPERLITTASNFLLDRRRIDSKTVATFVGFRAHWQYSDLLEKMFAACASHSDREKTLNFVLRYMRLDGQSSSVWKQMKQMAKENALALPDIERLIEHENRWKAASDNTNRYYGNGGTQSDRNSEIDWDTVFLDLDLHTSNGLSGAYANFRSNGSSFHYEKFFTELFKRISIGKAAEVIRAFPDVTEFDEYHLEPFLEQLPEEWKPQLAVKSSIADTIKKLCVRYCMRIAKDRYWQRGYHPLPLQLASVLSGISETDLIEFVVSAIGERAEILGANRLFSLVGLLATQISPDEALEALHFGLSLFDYALDENDGDGPWTAALEPPPDINEAVAGYIWAALAAPQASLRWEAAHVVRGLCSLGRQAVLDRLVELARDRTGGPFADSRLHFYHLHGRQWLMIALARVANENPEMLASYRDSFVHFALKDEPHVVIRHFAAKVALTLAESGSLDLDEDIAARLVSVNSSTLPVESSKRYMRVSPSQEWDTGGKRFSFGYDMSRYWFGRLGEYFGRDSADIKSEAEKVICDDWQLSENGYWDGDERNRRDLFRDDETRHSHGSYPSTDDLSFYLSYHAMMTVAGKLLATIPLHQDPAYPYIEFEEWLRGHLLSRQDGYWLADRRDPAPLEWPSWKNEKQEDDWRWSVCRLDFERVLGLDEDILNLWGKWNTTSGQREERADISSALVTSDRSFALLRALQTAIDLHAYRIPDAGDDLEIDESGFQLKGWVENRDFETGRDEFDPWAGAIGYPPLKPAKFVRDLFQLEADRECRVWQLQTEGVHKEVLWSQVWGSDHGQYYETEGEHGRRLQASHAFIAEFLGKVHMDLIIEVQIERRIRRDRYGRSKDDYLEYVSPYYRIFILRADGQTYSL